MNMRRTWAVYTFVQDYPVLVERCATEARDLNIICGSTRFVLSDLSRSSPRSALSRPFHIIRPTLECASDAKLLPILNMLPHSCSAVTRTPRRAYGTPIEAGRDGK